MLSSTYVLAEWSVNVAAGDPTLTRYRNGVPLAKWARSPKVNVPPKFEASLTCTSFGRMLAPSVIVCGPRRNVATSCTRIDGERIVENTCDGPPLNAPPTTICGPAAGPPSRDASCAKVARTSFTNESENSM